MEAISFALTAVALVAPVAVLAVFGWLLFGKGHLL